jgi:LytS/YehU family sensor histidine kinase
VIVQEDARLAEQDAMESKLLASRAELDSLKSTIHPHFLFNSLTAVSTLTVTSPQKAQKICIQLADFLRYSLQYSKKESATVKEELEHINNYLGVEQIRLGNRLKLDFDVSDDVLDQKILPFTLLPLIENAVKHGIQEHILGGTISLETKNAGEHLFIKVTNPCDSELPVNNRGGHGLRVLKERLNTSYKNAAEINTGRQNGNYVVRLYLPTQD